MKKIAEWWHSYRMIAAILAGVRHIFKLHPYNLDINLATGDRQLTWVRNTLGYLELPPLALKWLVWRHDRLVDFVNALVLETASREDMYDVAWRHYNEHICGEPDNVQQMQVGETLTPEEIYDRTKQTLTQAQEDLAKPQSDVVKKGKYEDG